MYIGLAFELSKGVAANDAMFLTFDCRISKSGYCVYSLLVHNIAVHHVHLEQYRNGGSFPKTQPSDSW